MAAPFLEENKLQAPRGQEKTQHSWRLHFCYFLSSEGMEKVKEQRGHGRSPFGSLAVNAASENWYWNSHLVDLLASISINLYFTTLISKLRVFFIFSLSPLFFFPPFFPCPPYLGVGLEMVLICHPPVTVRFISQRWQNVKERKAFKSY